MHLFARSAIIIIILISAALIGINIALKARTPPKVEKRAEPLLSVRTAHLPLQERRPALFLIGKVEALDYTTINAPIESDVLKITMREGEYFPKNKQLIHIDQRELEYTAAAEQARLDELNAQLQSIYRNRGADAQRLIEAERLLALAKKDYKRNQTLFEEKVLSLKQLEQSEQALVARQSEYTAMENQVADYDTQEKRFQAQIDAARAQLKQTHLLIERAKLRAPFAGRVAKIHTSVGARPPRGAALLDIFDPSQLRLRVAVAQRYASAIKEGNVRGILQDNDLQLTLAYAGIEPRVEEGNSSVDTLFSLPRGNWVLGAVRDIVLELPPVSMAAAAPVDSIYNDRFIYRVDSDSRAEAIPCDRLGLTRGENTQAVQVLITCETLQGNDNIIIDQLPNLLNGVLLKIINH